MVVYGHGLSILKTENGECTFNMLILWSCLLSLRFSGSWIPEIESVVVFHQENVGHTIDMSTSKRKQLKVPRTAHFQGCQTRDVTRRMQLYYHAQPISNTWGLGIDSSRNAHNSSVHSVSLPNCDKHEPGVACRHVGICRDRLAKCKESSVSELEKIFGSKCTVTRRTILPCGKAEIVLELWTGNKSQLSQINRMAGPTESQMHHKSLQNSKIRRLHTIAL